MYFQTEIINKNPGEDEDFLLILTSFQVSFTPI